MPKNRTRTLRLERRAFDVSVLSERQRATENVLRQSISTYVREQMGRLGGTLGTLAVDSQEIRLGWTPDANSSVAIDAILGLLKQGELPSAILLMRLLLSDDPDNVTILYNLGMALSDRGRLDEAVAVLERLLQVEPRHTNGRVALGVAQLRAGQVEPGVAALRQALDDEPQNPWAHRNLAVGLIKLGQTVDGIKHFRLATEHNPADDLAWLGLAQAYEITGDIQAADEAYKRVLAIDEYSPAAENAARLGRVWPRPTSGRGRPGASGQMRLCTVWPRWRNLPGCRRLRFATSGLRLPCWAATAWM